MPDDPIENNGKQMDPKFEAFLEADKREWKMQLEERVMRWQLIEEKCPKELEDPLTTMKDEITEMRLALPGVRCPLFFLNTSLTHLIYRIGKCHETGVL